MISTLSFIGRVLWYFYKAHPIFCTIMVVGWSYMFYAGGRSLWLFAFKAVLLP